MNRYTNLALAGLLGLAFASGIVAQTAGTSWGRSAVVIHGVAAIGLVALVPWKTPVVRRGLGRGRRGAWWSIALLVAVLITLASGLVQATGMVRRVGPLGMMQIHVGSAVLAATLAVAHYVRHPVRPRSADLGRRTLLRSAALGAFAGVLWVGWERAVAVASWPGAERRFTGSHERGSGDPAAMPVTQWLADRIPEVPAAWAITVGGRARGEAELSSMPWDEVSATLDCTSGWYSHQRWRGIRLDRLVDVGRASSIEVRSMTGYTRRFPARDAERLWLAFDLGDAPLSPGHGYPARLVAPGRRGFWWVKWVEAVEPSDVPWWLQLPFPIR